MQVVKDVLIERLINYLDELIFSGKVRINDQYETYEIFKTVKRDNVLRKYIYLESEIGHITEAQLLSSDYKILATKPYHIEKHEDGLVLAFEFILKIQEV